MPAELREKIEGAAKDSKRSLNAEIVARLESSVHIPIPTDEIVPASKAKEIAAVARKNLAIEVRSLVIDQLNASIKQGATAASIDLTVFPIMAYEDEASTEIADSIEVELTAAGYSISWDGPGHMNVAYDDL
ncbi:hypothetical protein BK635_13290 [Pseudomonas chlororaphis]|nr:hypothetical protein BK635_13290 [Pseudomonas chlororaphis]